MYICMQAVSHLFKCGVKLVSILVCVCWCDYDDGKDDDDDEDSKQARKLV